MDGGVPDEEDEEEAEFQPQGGAETLIDNFLGLHFPDPG